MSRLFNTAALQLLRLKGFRQRHFDHREAPVYYLEGGVADGPVVVILPGFGDTVFSWSSQLLELGTRMHVYALDFPGYNGFSRLPPGAKAMSFEDLEKTAATFLATEVGRADFVIGNSLGGWLGFRLAHDLPRLVGHLIAVNPGGVLTDEAEIMRIRDAFRIDSYLDFIDLMRNLWHRMPLTIFPASLLGFYQYTRRPEFGQCLDSIQEEHFINEHLGRITVPLSLIWGTEDKLFGPHMAEVIMKLAPKTKYYPIREAGHMPQLERPGEFLKVLTEIFAKQ